MGFEIPIGECFLYVLVVFLRNTYIIEIIGHVYFNIYDRSLGGYYGKENKTLIGYFF